MHPDIVKTMKNITPPPLLGRAARDRITGLSGIVIAHAQHLTGSERVLLQPRLKPNGDMTDPIWFDVERLVEDAGGVDASGFRNQSQ
jgi:hypothetical protein